MSTPRRLFIALGLTDSARRRLRAAFADCAPAGARPTAPANYHLTLVFIGDASPAELEICRRTLAACAPATLPPLWVEHIAPFPGPGSRLIAAHLHPSAELNALRRCLAQGTDTLTGTEERRRPWRPHITLARLPRGGQPLSPQNCDLRLEAGELGLYEGVHSTGGYRYQCLIRQESPPNRSPRASRNPE